VLVCESVLVFEFVLVLVLVLAGRVAGSGSWSQTRFTPPASRRPSTDSNTSTDSTSLAGPLSARRK